MCQRPSAVLNQLCKDEPDTATAVRVPMWGVREEVTTIEKDIRPWAELGARS